MTLNEAIATYLKALGVSPKLSGYRYLSEAIKLVIKDGSYIRRREVCKKLYPAIAEQFKTTASGVERNIRFAICKSQLRGSCDLQNKIWGYSLDPDGGNMTNVEFIAGLAEYVKIKAKVR